MKCRLPNAECRLKAEARPSRLCRGFSFTEILFAVMILGIGFIMVAALFPVAIQQTQSNNEEAITAGIAREGVAAVSRLASMQVTAKFGPTATPGQASLLLPTFRTLPNVTFPFPGGTTQITVPGQVWTFDDPRDPWLVLDPLQPNPKPIPHNLFLWQMISKNLVLPTDHHYAWVAMYRRDLIYQVNPATGIVMTPTPAPYAQVIIIGVQCRNRSAYDPINDVTLYNNGAAPALEPVVLQQSPQIRPQTNGTFVMSYNGNDVQRLVEGAYVVVSNDPSHGPYGGAFNGRVYRLGPQVNSTVWQLAPGSDETAGDASYLSNSMVMQNFQALVLGPGYDPNSNPPKPNQFAGPAQEIAVYTTLVQVN